MKNKFFKGEPLVISGLLKDDDVAVNSYTVAIRIMKLNSVLAELPLELNDMTYSIKLDTNKYYGSLTLRFVVYNTDGKECVVANNDINIVVEG